MCGLLLLSFKYLGTTTDYRDEKVCIHITCIFRGYEIKYGYRFSLLVLSDDAFLDQRTYELSTKRNKNADREIEFGLEWKPMVPFNLLISQGWPTTGWKIEKAYFSTTLMYG